MSPLSLFRGLTPRLVGVNAVLVLFCMVMSGTVATYRHHALHLAIDPATPTTIYAGTFNSRVFKSTDGGIAWKAIGPEGPRNLEIQHLAIDPITSTTVYAGGSSDLLKSTSQYPSFFHAFRFPMPITSDNDLI